MRTLLSICMLTFIMLVGTCQSLTVPFNVTVDYPFTWDTRSYTKIAFTFLTKDTSGMAIYTDLSRSKEFSTYDKPSNLKGFSLFGVFQIDMQKVILPSSGSASFSFTHDYSFGILNVNPKQLLIVGIDVNSKKIIPIDLVTTSATFTQQAILPLQTKVYTLGIMGLESEIPANFGIPTLVNYRASLKYEIHPNLDQYLSAFVNRPLSYPSHEYTARLVENRISLPSNQMVELFSFSFNPMFQASDNGNLVVHDFKFSFNNSKGFVDKSGNKINIDSSSLQCIYVVDESKGFVQQPGSSVVFPGLQQLACSPGIGELNFFPKYVTIVGNVNSNPKPTPEFTTLPAQQSNPIRKNSINTRNGASSVFELEKVWILLFLLIAYLL